MTSYSQKKVLKTNTLSFIYNFYMRFLALICLGFSIFYWLRLVGIFPGALWRFDLMPLQWQYLSGTLAIAYPIALIGLWMYSQWGIVLWCIAAVVETLAMTVYHSDFIYQPLLPLLHGTLFLILIIFKAIMSFKKIKRKVPTINL
ncbi:DUF6163 family protein [Bartonella sp. F02]|uniref:DUF6163 family protein n=1 Tax=Bartonella sp. F02 TaxID=2967262 RepID=UPI0022A90904|nr:DUF6163 family protein [Bartonella sp. F02]MCZ2328261.1 DUF6163 family protein [Bartonella sp. F02]